MSTPNPFAAPKRGKTGASSTGAGGPGAPVAPPAGPIPAAPAAPLVPPSAVPGAVPAAPPVPVGANGAAVPVGAAGPSYPGPSYPGSAYAGPAAAPEPAAPAVAPPPLPGQGPGYGPTDPTNPLGLPDDLIITGEAVALDVRPAMLLSRVVSGLIDVATSVALGLLIVLLGSQVVSNQARMGVLVVVTIATVMVILPTAVETLTRGLSVGKVVVGIRIVRDDGGPIRFRQAFARALAGTVEIWGSFGSIAVITSLVHSRGKRLGDLLAGTYAARVRGTELAMQPLLMPPDLAQWAAAADIRRLPDHVAVHARVFLSRTGTLTPETRVRAAQSLAAAVEPFVAPPPPWGTNPERFLAAVLVARRDREYVAAVARQEKETTEAERMRALPYGVADYS